MCDLTSLLTRWYFQARDLPGKRRLPPQVLNVQPCYVEASKRLQRGLQGFLWLLRQDHHLVLIGHPGSLLDVLLLSYLYLFSS